MRAVRKHTDCPWALMYIERWLKAPMQKADGSRIERERGTPQGGVISPLLANLFLHYAFDTWMQRNHPDIPFERYADDAICHCRSEEQAAALRNALEKRFVECGLTLHPEKTKIVYCKDDDRRGNPPDHKFDFLGYTFRPRLSRRRGGKVGVSFSPAASDKALKAIRQTVRAGPFTNAATRRWMIWRACSMRISAAGSTTTGGSTRRLSTRPYGASTSFWRDGPTGSSSPCAGTRHEPSTGCNASRAARLACLLIGPCSLDAAEQWEPYDARVSRTVLRERGGAITPAPLTFA